MSLWRIPARRTVRGAIRAKLHTACVFDVVSLSWQALPVARRTPDEKAALEARIIDLELRLKLLEARVRSAASAAAPAAPKRAAKPQKERPRCPGCLLELPPGRRGDSCVWCGFYFEAIRSPRGKARKGKLAGGKR